MYRVSQNNWYYLLFEKLLNKFILQEIKCIFINVHDVNFHSTNFTNTYKVLTNWALLIKNTINLKIVLQMASFLMNDNIMLMSKTPFNSNCTDPIFSNLFIIWIISCLLGCFSPEYSFFMIRITTCICIMQF